MGLGQKTTVTKSESLAVCASVSNRSDSKFCSRGPSASDPFRQSSRGGRGGGAPGGRGGGGGGWGGGGAGRGGFEKLRQTPVRGREGGP